MLKILNAIRNTPKLTGDEAVAAKIMEILGQITVNDFANYGKYIHRSILMDTGPIHMEQAKQLLEFSSDDVLDHFFDADLLNKFPVEQKAMLRQFKIVIYSKKILTVKYQVFISIDIRRI